MTGVINKSHSNKLSDLAATCIREEVHYSASTIILVFFVFIAPFRVSFDGLGAVIQSMFEIVLHPLLLVECTSVRFKLIEALQLLCMCLLLDSSSGFCLFTEEACC